MKLPSLPSSPNVLETLTLLLDKNERSLLIGNSKLAMRLSARGFKIDTEVDPFHKYKVAVFFDFLPKKHKEAVDWLQKKKEILEQKGILCVIEKSVPLDKRSLISKISVYYGLINPPERISQIFLAAGFKNISQVWPQGFRSILLTTAETSEC